MTEVALGKVALDKSKDERVRNFAERMVQDHSKANTELADIASRKHLDAPSQLDSEHEAMVQAMSGKSGSAFDAAYAQHMAADHSKALALFRNAAKSDDAALAAFARKTLPTLQEHKQMADSLRAGMRTAAATDTPTK